MERKGSLVDVTRRYHKIVAAMVLSNHVVSMITRAAAARYTSCITNLQTPLEPSYSISSLPAAFCPPTAIWLHILNREERRTNNEPSTTVLISGGLNHGLYNVSSQVDISNRPRHLPRTSGHCLVLPHHQQSHQPSGCYQHIISHQLSARSIGDVWCAPSSLHRQQ